MKSKILFSLIFIIAFGFVTNAIAQSTSMTHKPMSKEDSTALNALVMYPDSIRLDIFEACMFPAAIVNIATLQKNSSAEFLKAIGSRNKDEQEDIYNLTRYPGLIAKIVQGGKKSPEQLNQILVNYPPEIHNSALSYSSTNYELLARINEIQSQTNDQFEQIIAEYSPVTKEALRELVQMPEIISILNDHLELTVRVGDRYKRDPQRVIHKADSANRAQTLQNNQEVNDWKQSLKDNPDDANDLKQAGAEYAQENGYTQEEINMTPGSDYVANYTCYPYSYWFGYPSWYPYSYWYPYPFWFDCGYYYDAYGNIVVIGMPSYYFTNWYFYYPEHWYHHPRLGNRYVDHYYGRRDSHTRNSSVVHGWVNEHRDYLPKDFTENKTHRVEAIKQVGQMNSDAQKSFGTNQVNSVQRGQYLQNNAAKYPQLTPAKEPVRASDFKQENQVDYYKEQPVKQPAVKLAKPDQKPVVAPVQQPKQPVYQFNNINKAQDYHKSTWDQSQPKQQPQPAPRPQPAPTPQHQPQPAPQPQHQAPINPGGQPKRK